MVSNGFLSQRRSPKCAFLTAGTIRLDQHLDVDQLFLKITAIGILHIIDTENYIYKISESFRPGFAKLLSLRNDLTAAICM